MWLRLLLTFCLLFLVSCSDEPPTVGVDTAFGSVCDESNEGQRIAVEGFLRLPDSFTGDQSIVLRLFETDAFDGTPIGVTVPIGNEPNQVSQVPPSYNDDDLQAYLNNGQSVGYGTPVKVSGKVYYPLVDQDFVCGLENVLIEAGS